MLGEFEKKPGGQWVWSKMPQKGVEGEERSEAGSINHGGFGGHYKHWLLLYVKWWAIAGFWVVERHDLTYFARFIQAIMWRIKL